MLEAKVMSLDNGNVGLSFLDGQKITIPVSAIEGTPKINERVFVLFASPGSENGANQKLAKFLLNELINS